MRTGSLRAVQTGAPAACPPRVVALSLRALGLNLARRAPKNARRMTAVHLQLSADAGDARVTRSTRPDTD